MYKAFVYIMFFSLLVIPVFSQQFYQRSTGEDYIQPREGRVQVFQDGRIDLLVARHIEENKKGTGVPGFRVRIFSQSGHNARQNANQVRAEFLRRYPDMEGYLTYDAPNFKVYVGDFRTRSEAIRFHKRVSRDFPNAFIVIDQINLTGE